MLPLAELALLLARQIHHRLRYREAPGRFRQLIIAPTWFYAPACRHLT
jgi:hypothetical protein